MAILAHPFESGQRNCHRIGVHRVAECEGPLTGWPANGCSTLSRRGDARVQKKRERADLLLLMQGLASSRSQAQALLLAGRVYMGDQRIDKPGTGLPIEARLTVAPGPKFVSRGGLKLEGALTELELSVKGLSAADVGASTGGFTDCLLQHGAKKVYAIDVGHGQLAQKLRDDPRVVVLERTNARHLKADSLGELVELVVVDASFISLEKLLGGIGNILKPGGLLLALIKPQFEVGRREASRGQGVVRDAAVRDAVIRATLDSVSAHGFRVRAECACALKGPKGNLEHFVLAARPG